MKRNDELKRSAIPVFPVFKSGMHPQVGLLKLQVDWIFLTSLGHVLSANNQQLADD